VPCQASRGATVTPAVEIAAGFQAEAIAEHEADLVAIRQECGHRVAKAHEVVRGVGIE